VVFVKQLEADKIVITATQHAADATVSTA
jgi:hypothetical protein